jgi:hypothetical protein
MNAVSPRVSLVAGALILLVGCYSNNAGRLDLDGGFGGTGADGGFAGGGGNGNGGNGGDGGAAGQGGGGGSAGTGATAGSGGSGGAPLSGDWQPPVIIDIPDVDDGFDVKPHVAIGANGEAFAVWVQSFLGAYNVWTNRYTPGGGWETAEMIGTTNGDAGDLSKTSQPHVVVDADGAATAAWGDFTDPIVRRVVARRYDAPDGWADPALLDNGLSTAGDPRLSVDPSANVMAVFAIGTNVWANRFNPTDGWGGAEVIDNEPGGPTGVQVALAPDGSGWSLWSQAPTGLTRNIFGNRFVPGDGWGEAGKVENRATGSALAARLALDSRGNGLFIWHQTAGLSFQVWSNTWDDAAENLSNPVRVDLAGIAKEPVVASDPQGNGTAVWIQSPQASGGILQIAASRYTPGTGWSAPEILAEGQLTSQPRVATDSQGNAVVVYTQLVPPEDQVDAWAHTYSGGAWSAAVRLGEEDLIGGAFQPSVAMAPNGNAVAVWRDDSHICASTFE